MHRLDANLSASQSVSMAVINSPWVGDARGKLAGGVYLRVKGQTLARGYNPSPLNRRTSPQQLQRSLFSSAVRFYTKGVQNLFKFAFEGKPTKESDYNAFMRHNAKLGMYFGPEENSNEAFGSLAPWVLSRGSLAGLGVFWSNGDLSVYTFSPTSSTPPAVPTVGWLSGLYLAAEGYLPGDIITFLRINTYEQPGSAAYPYANVPSTMPEWSISQFVLDEGDTRSLSELNIRVDYQSSNVRVWMGDAAYSEFAQGAAVIHSRVTSGQLLVSDAELSLNDMGSLVWRFGRTRAWQQLVLAAWNAEDKSILQGSRVKARQSSDAVQIVADLDLPTSVSSLSNVDIYLLNVTDIDSVFSSLRFFTGSTTYIRLRQSSTEGVLELNDGNDTFGTATYAVDNGYIIISFNTVSPGPSIVAIRWVED